nr:zinc finger, CCHC-type [Tanacetum cinerariifolium]
MKEDETIDTFTAKLTTLANKAAGLGHTFDDSTLVRKLLNAVPDRYLQIVASIEQYSDLGEMSLEEAIGRLKAYEERIKFKKGKQVNDQEKLMFTRHDNRGKNFRGREDKIAREIKSSRRRTTTNPINGVLDNEREVVDLEVSLHEEDVGYKETTKDSQWYLDNGASNHMTGMRDHFENLDEKVSGRVKFGD